MFSFLTPYMTYIKVGITIIAVAALASLYGMMSHYKAKVVVLTMQISECRKANADTVATNESMKQELNNAGIECVTRLAIKDDRIKKLEKMLNTKGESANEKPASGSSGDDVLDLLNGVYAKANYTGGICQGASGGAIAAGAGPGSGVLLLRRYCFASKQDVINWLINQSAHDAREKDLESIIMSHQTKSTP